jgi:hypothetical protein
MLGAIRRQKFRAPFSRAAQRDRGRRATPPGELLRATAARLTASAARCRFWPQPIQWAGVILGVLCSLAAVVLGRGRLSAGSATATFRPTLLGTLIVSVLGVQVSSSRWSVSIRAIQRVVNIALCTIDKGSRCKRVR